MTDVRDMEIYILNMYHGNKYLWIKDRNTKKYVTWNNGINIP